MNNLVGEAWITSDAKRCSDIAISAAMMPFAIPAMAVATSAVRIVDNVNPLFVQQRMGHGNQPYAMYKLRTMPFETEDTASSLAHKDLRRSKLGKFLAKTRTDEAPQFLNIFRGDMTIVGYRSLIPEEYKTAQAVLSKAQFEFFMYARSVGKPGLLHLIGIQNPSMNFANETELWRARYDSEREYFEKASAGFDWHIMLKSAQVGGQLLTNKVT